ncbi:class I adenylate-forming enzyme family protein [Jatrophihabitans fulvus]
MTAVPEETSQRPTLVEAILQRRVDSRDRTLHFVGLDGTTHQWGLGPFLDEALLLAASLRSRGLRTGDVVAVRGGNTLAFSRAVTACVLAGLTTLPLVSLLGDADVEQVLQLSGAALLLSEPAGPKRPLTDHLSRIAAAGAPPVSLLSAPDTAPPDVPGAVVLPGADEPWPADRFPADDDAAAFLLYTSGTTGVPKGVLHTYASLWAEVQDWASSCDLIEGGHVFAPFPLGHVAGLDSLLVSTCLGRDLTMIAAWDAAVAADALLTHGATAGGSTPFYATTLFDEFDRRGITSSPLTVLQSGGGVVGAQLVRRAEAYGVTMMRAYGSTEHPSATSGRSHETLAERADTDGRPGRGTSVRILDESGVVVPDGVTGEVALQGPEQFLGYVGGEPARDTDGWFHTGDLGHMTDGRLTITGRKKDVIIRGGENISVLEVEQILASCPGVAEAAVVGVPDERYGERVRAFVVRERGADIVDLAAVRAHFAAAAVARHKTPESVQEVAELPRNALGKVQRHRLVPQTTAP